MEIYKDIPNYKGYQVSNLGNVKSLKRKNVLNERMLKGTVNSTGYLVYSFNKGKKMKAHQLVAMAFLNHVPSGYKGLVVDHRNNDKLDNRLDNLQLITHRLNVSKDRKKGSSKYTGVSKMNNKYTSKIALNGKYLNLGSFKTEIEAHECYQKALFNFEKNGIIPEIKPKTYSSKYKGVYWNKPNKNWLAHIKINGKAKHIGSFKTETEAYEFREKALKNHLKTL